MRDYGRPKIMQHSANSKAAGLKPALAGRSQAKPKNTLRRGSKFRQHS
jgi:hypothetical protein